MSIFQFKHFAVKQSDAAMKVGTDAMLLGSLIDAQDKLNGLDIGSGTGVLSLMIAQANPKIFIDALEIDRASALEASFNFSQSEWKDRLNLIKTDFLLFETSRKYDLIFSNPPFYQNSIPNADARLLQAKHIDEFSIRSFINQVESMLASEGELWIIVPAENSEVWIHAASENQLNMVLKIEISGKQELDVNRLILQFSRHLGEPDIRQFVIRNEDGSYSEEYKKLTQDFHGTELV